MSLKASQAQTKRTLVDLKVVCEDLTRYAFELNNVISDMKVKEGSLKVINDKFGANVERLQTALKTA